MRHRGLQKVLLSQVLKCDEVLAEEFGLLVRAVAITYRRP